MKGTLRKYTVEIKEVATGRTAIYHDQNEWDTFQFMWTMGNYSCDCNRELFFRRSLNLPELPDEEETQCGNTKYFCRGVSDETGAVEFDELGEVKYRVNSDDRL